MSGRSFEQGEGHWRGAAEVYDAAGNFAGEGHDARAVRRDLDDGTVEVEVGFTGPFRLSGSYVIADHGDHRLYLGPLNHGYAEVLGERLIDTHNYWPDIGLSQRLCLMVLPGGGVQLSLALLSRGEQATYTVVGEYERRPVADPPGVSVTGSSTIPPAVASGAVPGAGERGTEPEQERSGAVLERPGTWSGTLELIGPDGDVLGTAGYRERVERVGQAEQVRQVGQAEQVRQVGQAEQVRQVGQQVRQVGQAEQVRQVGQAEQVAGQAEQVRQVGQVEHSEHAARVGAAGHGGRLEVALTGTGFAEDAAITLCTDGRQRWTGGGDVVGSESRLGRPGAGRHPAVRPRPPAPVAPRGGAPGRERQGRAAHVVPGRDPCRRGARRPGVRPGGPMSGRFVAGPAPVTSPRSPSRRRP